MADMTNWEKVCAEYDKKRKELERVDQRARKAGELVGRYIREPYADSHAVYKIVKVNKNTVVIEVVTGIGDDWTIPYWGRKATIKKEYAEQSIRNRDRLDDFLKRRERERSENNVAL